MASIVEIANMALIQLGCQQIVALTDSVPSAIAIRASWPHTRDMVLRAYPWSCLRRTAILQEIYRNGEGTGEYTIPHDCIRGLYVYEGNQELSWTRINGNSLRIPFARAPNFIYTARIEDTEQYDSMLVMAQAAFLAQHIAQALVQSSEKKQEAYKMYQNYVREARSVDSQEGSMKRVQADDWLIDRHTELGNPVGQSSWIK